MLSIKKQYKTLFSKPLKKKKIIIITNERLLLYRLEM